MWLLWQTSNIFLLMNKLIVTYNIKKTSAWAYMTRLEDDWLSASQSNQLLQLTSEVSLLPSLWSRSMLQHYTWGNWGMCDQHEYWLNSALKKDGMAPGNTTSGLRWTKLMGRHLNWMSWMSIFSRSYFVCVNDTVKHSPWMLFWPHKWKVNKGNS